MKLTIGMATYQDYDGLHFTVQSLRMHSKIHEDDNVELLVVDNCPSHKDASRIKQLTECTNHGGKIRGRYIPMETPVGTSAPRQRIFDEAEGDVVLCMDSHVLLPTDTPSRLLHFFSENPDTPNLYTGPMIYDGMGMMSTHFDMIWRSEMWGIWAHAWRCKCGHPFTVINPEDIGKDDDKPIQFHSLEFEVKNHRRKRCAECYQPFPVNIRWPGHQQILKQKFGYTQAGWTDDEPIFKIPAMGLGLFTCRKDAWLGFLEGHRMFGGEEGYIHEKYEQAGHSTFCLPWLKWNHKFRDPKEASKYPLMREAKVCNYVAEFDELGRDKTDIYEHFVATGRLSESAWTKILADPLNFELPTPPPTASQMEALAKTIPESPHGLPNPNKTLDEIFEWVAHKERDMNQHLPVLRSFAARCDHVTEFTKRRESSVGLVAALPKKVISYQKESDPLLDILHHVLRRTPNKDHNTEWTSHIGSRCMDSLQGDVIEETDLLFIDNIHTGKRIFKELVKHGQKVRKYVAFHDTHTYGMEGEDGGPGLAYGIRKWINHEWEEYGREWQLAYHNGGQHGFTIYSSDPKDWDNNYLDPWPPGEGPGTELKKILEGWNIKPESGCACQVIQEQMDRAGIEGCEENISLIVSQLEIEAKKRPGLLGNLPFKRKFATVLVKQAIRAWKKELSKREAEGYQPEEVEL